jgi:hypothetical protein
MNWPIVLSTGLGIFAFFGLVCLLLIAVYWKTVGRLVSDLWPKLATKTIQLISGAVSLFGAYSVGTQKEAWFPAVLAGIACVAVWEVVGQLIDNRVKAADRVDKAALGRAELQSKLRTQLLTGFRFAVDNKARRVRRELERPRGRTSTTRVRNALTPHPHLGELLQNLAVFYQAQLPSEGGENRNFRVGVYVNCEGVMTPVQSISLNDSSYTPFTSYQAHQPAFRLDTNTNPSHVVNCVRQKRMIVVEDCAKTEEEGTFHFFTEGQRSYLRSFDQWLLFILVKSAGKMVR